MYSNLIGKINTALFNANKADSKTADISSTIDEMALTEADMLINICCLQLGIDPDDLLTQEVEE